MRTSARALGRIHTPVLLNEVTSALLPALQGNGLGSTCEGKRPLLVDCTVGMGGHARALLEASDCRLAAVDRDRQALALARENLKEFSADGRVTFSCSPYSQVEEALKLHEGEVDAVLLDIGVSSLQLDNAERGFSFRPDMDGPLDMRMDQHSDSITAADVVNHYPEIDLAAIIFHLGEERASRRISKAIAQRRPFTRTFELAQVIRNCFPKGSHMKTKRDPSTKTFQALRMYVNQELRELQTGMQVFERLLRPGGRMAVISFHSLEDRIVKEFLWHCSGKRNASASNQPLHAHLLHDNSASVNAAAEVLLGEPAFTEAVGADWMPSMRLVNRKVITADKSEVQANPRCRSAKLRVAERLDAPALGADVQGRSWSDKMLAI